MDPVAPDNCPTIYNEDQADIDDDALGDSCDPDLDGDLVANLRDNCVDVVNPAQGDADRDGSGDSCDDGFCYVVMGDDASCLDPAAPLRVYSPPALAQTGEALRLRLFANRENQAMTFAWRVVDAPEDSHPILYESNGTVTISTPFEYHYLSDKRAAFTAELTVDGDKVGVAGADEIAGCAAGGGLDFGLLAALGLAFGGLVLLRRRRPTT